eukprot:13151043-Ditylum_brightwellii.AAC.1
MYANAAYVPTRLGGGAYGHIGLVMDTALYAMLSTMIYSAPSAPVRTTIIARTQLVNRDAAET